MLTIRRYKPEDASHWDEFLSRSRNGLFLFRRAYMDYHQDRFKDASFLIEDEGRTVALLPASESDSVLASHAGLTFGGLLVADTTRATGVVSLTEALVEGTRKAGFVSIKYKQIPAIFSSPIGGEDSYALARVGARATRVDANFVLDLHVRPRVQERRVRSAKKATKSGVTLCRSADFASFWAQVLEPTLLSRHGVRPVHQLSEMELLQRRFPDNIVLHVASKEGRPVAGVVLYLYGHVWHTQYIAANEEGREVGALDLVIQGIIEAAPLNVRFLSFGISTEDEGRVLNAGLAEWKESFGARVIPHYVFEV